MRGRRTPWITAAVVACAVLPAAPASAGGLTIGVGDTTLTFTAAPGETNTLIVNRVAAGNVEVTDTSGTPIVLPAQCSHPGGVTSIAQCLTPGGPLDKLVVALGDGADSAVFAAGSIPWRSLSISGEDGADVLQGASIAPCTVICIGYGAILDGGPGNDTLTAGATGQLLRGGSGNDTLNGGPGDDDLDGGTGGADLSGAGGVDVVSYTGRTVGVSANLASASRDDGSAEDCRTAPICVQRDGIGDDVEVLVGGDGPDLLVGGASADTLYGA